MRITVYAGSSRRSAKPYLAVAHDLGESIAKAGHTLVYGGGRTGLMGALADGALGAGGRVDAVILRRFIEEDVHHTGVTLSVVEDMRARKRGLEEAADAFIALPGGVGTLEELAEVLSFRKLGLHDRVLVFLNARDYYAPLLAQIERAISDGFEKPAIRDAFEVATDAGQALAICERSLSARSGSPGAF